MSLRQQADVVNDIWLKYYDHFRLRLNERYNLDVSFKEYLFLCKERVDKILITPSKKKCIGWLMIRGVNVLVAKDIKRNRQLSTALYPDIQKITKRQDNDTTIPNYPKNP